MKFHSFCDKVDRMVPLQSANVLMPASLIFLLWNIFPTVEAFFVSTPTLQSFYRYPESRGSMTAIPMVYGRDNDMASLSLDDESVDVDEGDLLNTMDWDVIEQDDDEDEEEVDLDRSEDDETTAAMNDDSEVLGIFNEWLSIREEENSAISPKIAVIPQLFNSMDGWSVSQYNQLLQLISKHGSIRDAEACLYHMIQEIRWVNDESFYHVFTSYTQHEKRKPSNKKRNRRKWGIAFKLEQLLALQDALVRCTPTARTLKAALRALAEDQTDTKVALRAKRIWDRLLNLSDGEAPLASAVSLLQACSHVPSEAAPDEKLEAFTIALEVFNGVTAESQTEQQSRTYAWFLRACRTLLAGTAERKRDAVVEAAFRRACTAGVVNTAILKSLSAVASDACMLRLLGGFLEDGIETPPEWSRHCTRQHAATAQAIQNIDSS
jgi:hypothetical protein